MKSNFYFGSSDAPLPAHLPHCFSTPITFLLPLLEKLARLFSLLLLYFSCLSLFRPNFSREKRLRDASTSPPPQWITASRPGLSKTRTVSFLSFFFLPPSLRLKFDMEKEGEEEGKGQRKFGGSLTFSIERTWRMTTERGGLIFKRWKFSMQSSWNFTKLSFFDGRYIYIYRWIHILNGEISRCLFYLQSSSQFDWRERYSCRLLFFRTNREQIRLDFS